jgi:hypothetical protein
MTGIGWRFVDVASRLLDGEEGEAVRGDLVEAGESAGQGLLHVVGLIVRREALVWKSWRPWLAAFGLAMPSSFVLMGFSLSVSSRCEHWMDAKAALTNGPARPALLLICYVLLLIGWSWTGGFVVGSVSRRTLWASVAAACLPCLFCLARFRLESRSRFCLLIFLLPAIWGVRQGLRVSRIQLNSALVLAAAVTGLMILPSGSGDFWHLNWTLLWPTWYMVATARRDARRTQRRL